MTKSSMLLAAAVLAGSASAFAPSASMRASTKLFEDAVAEAEPEAAPAEPAFCLGYVGGEGPEPIPFAGISQSSVNWDPLDFAGVSRDIRMWRLQLHVFGNRGDRVDCRSRRKQGTAIRPG